MGSKYQWSNWIFCFGHENNCITSEVVGQVGPKGSTMSPGPFYLIVFIIP